MMRKPRPASAASIVAASSTDSSVAAPSATVAPAVAASATAASATAASATAAFIEYANGVPSSSPGLRAPRYPGNLSPHAHQPHRGCAFSIHLHSITNPRVGLISFGQHWDYGDMKIQMHVDDARAPSCLRGVYRGRV